MKVTDQSSSEVAEVLGMDVKDCFQLPSLNVMNFLNEVVLQYPEAISLAPGRPAEELFDLSASLAEAERYVAYRSRQTGLSEGQVRDDLGQYNKTNGIIRDLIARHLEVDEGIRVPEASIAVTAGCQEAMLVLLLSLFEPGKDVLLASDPTYIGITGLADILGIRVEPVLTGGQGLQAERVVAAAEKLRQEGLRPRALYDIPDFNNPLGTRLSLPDRHRLLTAAREQDLLIFEDNPYGQFSFDDDPAPTLKSLDEEATVIYLGTFSKTLFPGLRVGYLVADQPVEEKAGGGLLAEQMSKVKSLTTVTTSPLMQAVAGGILLRHGGSLKPVVAPKVEFYRRNRDALLSSLDRYLGDLPGVSWNRPGGGFFMTVELPFPFDLSCLEICADQYGLICCPMSFFSRAGSADHQVRFSFSYVTQAQIDTAIERFSRFLRARLEDS